MVLIPEPETETVEDPFVVKLLLIPDPQTGGAAGSFITTLTLFFPLSNVSGKVSGLSTDASSSMFYVIEDALLTKLKFPLYLLLALSQVIPPVS